MERRRRKFAKPPVKVACLSCRASRIRCDGKQTCSPCTQKGKPCVYTTSNRGGPRFPRKIVESDRRGGDADKSAPYMPVESRFEEEMFYVTAFSTPGAGLVHLDELQEGETGFADYPFLGVQDPYSDPEFLQPGLLSGFGEHAEASLKLPDTIVDMDDTSMGLDDSSVPGLSDTSINTSLEPVGTPARLYGSDSDILDAYYVYMHAYFPILPPPVRFPPIDRPSSSDDASRSAYQPSSPLTLALSAILALVPFANDSERESPPSVWRRREQAHRFACGALECIEVETELIESTISPSKALSLGKPRPPRLPVHPNVPLYLESILALLVLSIYEYAQRGNIAKMRSRAGQAFIMALDMRLWSKVKEDEAYAEARRRAWWMTYICVCQGSIVSNTLMTLDLEDPRFEIEFPKNISDPGVWAHFVEAQQCIARTTELVMELNECLDKGHDLSDMYRRQAEMEKVVEQQCKATDLWAERSAPTMPVDPEEAVVAKALRSIGRIKMHSARIKIHRYSAFNDTAIFTQKHCDLHSIQPDGAIDDLRITPGLSCVCGSIGRISSHGIPSSSEQALRDPYATFNSTQSAKICRRAALNVAQSFDTLPYPNPTGIVDPNPGPIPVSLNSLLPRMMPTFACCAMQSSYALLMLCYKAYADKINSPNEDLDLVVQGYIENLLQQGVRLVLGALENYSLAFEALGGMREQIEEALESPMFVTDL